MRKVALSRNGVARGAKSAVQAGDIHSSMSRQTKTTAVGVYEGPPCGYSSGPGWRWFALELA